MNKIKSQLKMHYINSKLSFIIFWSIMLSISVLGILISIFLRSRGYHGVIVTNNFIAVVVFGAISGLVAYNETLPYMLNMGITRKSFVFGFIAYNIILSIVLSILFALLTLLEGLVYNLLGFTSQQMDHLFFSAFSKGEILERVLLYFAITLVATAFFTLVGSIYYKKGMMFLFGLGALIMLLMFIPGVPQAVFEALKPMILSLTGDKGYLLLMLYSMIFLLACYAIIYPLARTSQIKR